MQIGKKESKEAFEKISLILKNRSLLTLLESMNNSDLNALPREVRLSIVKALSDEFVEKGLMENDEPNDYGKLLEYLIDCCNLTSD